VKLFKIIFLLIRLGHDRHPLYGVGKSWPRGDVERLLHKLTLECFLAEIHVASKDGIVNTYTKIGPRASQLLNGTAKVGVKLKSLRFIFI
jgi:bloom syndrome protein